MELLQRLTDSTNSAAAYFCEVEEGFFDGYQTAREVISHFVFWHREYVDIVQTLVDGEEPVLRKGRFAMFNALAAEEFADKSLPILAQKLVSLQRQLVKLLVQLPDWSINLPMKSGSRHCTVARRVRQIDAHIRNHLARLERAERHGSAWIDAYYREAL